MISPSRFKIKKLEVYYHKMQRDKNAIILDLDLKNNRKLMIKKNTSALLKFTCITANNISLMNKTFLLH